MKTRIAGALSLALLLAAPPALAQDYPNKPIEFICATSAGSTAAQWCQLMAQELGKPDALGQPVHVSYRGGGSGNEAAAYSVRKGNDGYTLLHANASWAGYMNLPTFSEDPDQFKLAAKVEKFLYSLAVPADSEFKTIEDVVTYAKENPGTLSVAGNKIGSIHHKHIVAFFNAAGAEVNYIPYEGSGDAVKDVLGKHVPIGLGTIGQWAPHVEAGTIRPLVLLNEERVAAVPDLPVPSDMGLDYPMQHQWQGFFLLDGTPPEVHEKLSAALAKVVEGEEYKKYLDINKHVTAALDTDMAKLDQEFTAEKALFQEFMVENGIISN